MHVSLSDQLICPRCGPEWGLVLVPDVVRERRVEEGSLGCPRCRTRYAIEGGVGRLAVEGGVEGGGEWRPDDGAMRLAALLGLGDRRGVVLLAGPATVHGPRLAGLLESVEVVLAEPPAPDERRAGAVRVAGVAEAEGGAAVSRLEVGRRIPLRGAGTAGVALTGGAVAMAEEGVRVLGPGARILLDPVDEAGRAAAKAGKLRVLAEEGGALVATR
jgi:uncharacterized protein YbaR (Trm112 family)